jgi:hypothetical protein
MFWVLLSLTSLILVSCGGGGGGGDSKDSKQWTYPSDLSDYISFDGWSAILPRVAMGNNGDAIIVWQQGGGNYHETFKSEYRAGNWTNPVNLNDHINPLDGAINPLVAMDDNGEAVIVWTQLDENYNAQVFKSEYRNGSWTHPSGLSDNISPDGSFADFPQVAVDKNGNAIIVWYQNAGSSFHIFKSEYR